MTLATDQNSDRSKLSANARRLLELRDQVLTEWVKRVRATVQEATDLHYPILIDTFPALYDNLAEAITPTYPREKAATGTTVALEHGSERARLTGYNVQALVSEYQVLRWTIFDVAAINGIQFNTAEFYVINSSLDDSIKEAVEGFSLAQAALRERFAAALAHDLRNPLAAANAAANLISRITDQPKLKQLAETILQHHARMDNMLNELLDTVVSQNGERLILNIEQFDMRVVAQEVYDEFVAIHGERFVLHGPNVLGFWDRNAFKRAMENLMSNAVKYGDVSGHIRMKIMSQHERIILSVHNDGNAIPPDQLEHIFRVFQRVETVKRSDMPGWGIGLPYVRCVAESHGGTVAVDSAAERGTTITIDVPVDSRPYQSAPTLTLYS